MYTGDAQKFRNVDLEESLLCCVCLEGQRKDKPSSSLSVSRTACMDFLRQALLSRQDSRRKLQKSSYPWLENYFLFLIRFQFTVVCLRSPQEQSWCVQWIPKRNERTATCGKKPEPEEHEALVTRITSFLPLWLSRLGFILSLNCCHSRSLMLFESWSGRLSSWQLLAPVENNLWGAATCFRFRCLSSGLMPWNHREKDRQRIQLKVRLPMCNWRCLELKLKTSTLESTCIETVFLFLTVFGGKTCLFSMP